MSALRSCRRGEGELFLSKAIVLLLLMVFPLLAKAETQTLLLDVQINGYPIGKIGEFILRDGKLLIKRSELHDLGIRGPLSLISKHFDIQDVGSDELLGLSDLPGLTWRVDYATQTVYLLADEERLVPVVLEGSEGATVRSGRRSLIESGTGVTLNYDMATILRGGQLGSSGSLDLRVFSPWGVASSGMLAHTGPSRGSPASNQSAGPSKMVRLDTSYTFADVKTMRRYSVGDFITGSLSWTRPVRLTGAQLRSDFSMQPDLVTFPLPTVSGSAAIPSTVDVLANGNLVLSHDVDAGPFQISQLPVVNGASTISMTVTNVLGQQISVTKPFYASAALLSPGLQTFSVQMGLVRRNWGEISNDYGEAAAVGSYRRGLTRAITMEGSIEGTSGTLMAGGGATVSVGSLGILTASVAGSTDSGVYGTRFSVGAQRIGTVLSFGASEMISSRSFEDVAAINGDSVPRRQLSANAGVFRRHVGSFGLAYAEISQDASLHPLPLRQTSAQHGQILSGSYSLQFSRFSIYANEYKDFANGGNGGVQAGVTISLGGRRSVDVSAGSGNAFGQVRVQRSAAEIGEWGYDAYVSATQPAHAFAQVQYKSPRSLLTAGIDQEGMQTTMRMESEGAVSLLDGGLFPSNTIYDSFAVVDTNGLGHVRVLQENRDVGTTNSKGRLLVPDMRAFQLNHLAIDANDVPLDTTIDTNTREIRPQDRSGVVVGFAVKVSHGALLRLVDEAGEPLSVGSRAKLLGTNVVVPIGYDGEAYVEEVSSRNKLDVELPDGRKCRADFHYTPVKGVVPTIGPLPCHDVQP